ncbi:1-acyl-sn-glycerol-3-phosphate acyltransferase [Woodsholea maritima]|uniref:1-acyl-sn-glycerol-3-phosphate acyltransferase n=1 Tax=Woodsholea maritima TaxID=240237 RepID=UPI00036A75A9|nr:1-acyl-sn-glycerol-3-phosphate acyltransferase [Woodsholea maritima]
MSADLPAPRAHSHIVDTLIEERATHLMARARLWALIRAVLYPMLGYKKAVKIADALRDVSGREAMDFAQDFLRMRLSVEGLDHVPAEGPCVILANHPGGIADGVAVWQMLKNHRPDTIFFANRDAIRVCPGLSDHIIPVEWRAGERNRDKTRETLKQAMTAFKDGKCIVVFPAGRMAHWSWAHKRLVEGPWMPTGVSLARKFRTPLIPMGVTQRMSLAFYGLGQIHEELRHMTVFYELLAKKQAHYTLRLAAPYRPEDLGGSEGALTEQIKAECEALAWGLSFQRPEPTRNEALAIEGP